MILGEGKTLFYLFCVFLAFELHAKTSYRLEQGLFKEHGLESPTRSRELATPTDEERDRQSDLSFEWGDSQVLRGGASLPKSNPYTNAIGKMNGCTATLASPPSSEVAVVILASHCRGGSTLELMGREISGFKCFKNRDYSGRGRESGLRTWHASQDVSVCFAKQQVDTGFYGCMANVRDLNGSVGDKIRMYGFGNPVEGLRQVRTLLRGTTRVTKTFVKNSVMNASGGGGALLTAGDSGGPVEWADSVKRKWVKSTIENPKFFEFFAVNSQASRSASSVATFTDEILGEKGFIERALSAYTKELDDDKQKVQICGYNYDPDKESTIETPISPLASKPAPQKAEEPPLVQKPRKKEPQQDFSKRRPRPPTNYIPRDPGDGTRLIAVNGKKLPPNAIGYRMLRNGRIAWVFSSSDETENIPSRNPTPILKPEINRNSKPSPLLPEKVPALQKYESGMKYITGNLRTFFGGGAFKDLESPRILSDGKYQGVKLKSGNGKLIFAYSGQRDLEFERRSVQDPRARGLLEVRHMTPKSPELRHARLFNVGALSADGLGRKITRYGTTREEALNSLLSSKEPELLEAYLDAQKALQLHHAPKPLEETTAPKPRELASVPRTPTNDASFNHLINGKCLKCHESSPGTPFPGFLKDWTEWTKRLETGDKESKEWLSLFNSQVVHGSMLEISQVDRTEKESVRKLIAEAYEKYIGRVKADKPTKPKIMVGEGKQAEYLKAIKDANISDPEIRNALTNFDLLYDRKGAPQYSFAPHGGESGRKGVRSVERQPAGPVLPNIFERRDGQWHWKAPFDSGFSQDSKTKGLQSFFVTTFPKDDKGEVIKGVHGTEKYSGVRQRNGRYGSQTPDPGDLSIPWISYPAGTKIFEVQYTKDSKGNPVVIDILSRTKRIEEKEATWVPNAIRMDSHPERIKEWLEKQTDKDSNPDLVHLAEALNNPKADGIRSRLGADGSGGAPFTVQGKRSQIIPGSKSVLEGVKEETLLRLYQDLPLSSALGSSGWQLELKSWFEGSHRGIAIDTKTCTNCHKHAGESFKDVFTTSGLERFVPSVAAYGNVGGSDGILSAPLFGQEEISQYGPGFRYKGLREEIRNYFEKYTNQDPNRVRRSTPWRQGERPLTSEE